MKTKSMSSSKWYVVGGLSVTDIDGALRIDERWGGRKWVHIQSTEQMPDWNSRPYGSSKTFKVKGKIWDALNKWLSEVEMIAPTLSMRGSGMAYVQIAIEECGTHFQVMGVPEGNRWYGFAFDAKEVKS